MRGGYATIMKWWNENKIEPPILLANRDNAAVIKVLESGSDNVATPAQQRAFEMTSRGGVKTTQLAGAIFNHKDDKKAIMIPFSGGGMRMLEHSLHFLTHPIPNFNHIVMLQQFCYSIFPALLNF